MGKTIQQIPHPMGTFYLLDVKPDEYLLTYQSYDGFGNKKEPKTINVPFHIDGTKVLFDQRNMHIQYLITWLLKNNIQIKQS